MFTGFHDRGVHFLVKYPDAAGSIHRDTERFADCWDAIEITIELGAFVFSSHDFARTFPIAFNGIEKYTVIAGICNA